MLCDASLFLLPFNFVTVCVCVCVRANAGLDGVCAGS